MGHIYAATEQQPRPLLRSHHRFDDKIKRVKTAKWPGSQETIRFFMQSSCLYCREEKAECQCCRPNPPEHDVSSSLRTWSSKKSAFHFIIFSLQGPIQGPSRHLLGGSYGPGCVPLFKGLLEEVARTSDVILNSTTVSRHVNILYATEISCEPVGILFALSRLNVAFIYFASWKLLQNALHQSMNFSLDKDNNLFKYTEAIRSVTHQ
jgi:hypothetical protein